MDGEGGGARVTDRAMAAALDEVRRRSLPTGGFPDLPGGDERPDATAWAALALTVGRRQGGCAEAACDRLAAVQQADGRVSVSAAHADAFWPTPLAVLAWHCSPGHEEARQRAIRFLLTTTGRHWRKDAASVSAHDTDIKGWSWTAGAHSWVEPTAICLTALKVSALGGHARSAEAVRLLVDRQLPTGGWNYGNTMVYGRELRPQIDCTGVALEALAGLVPRARVETSLDCLRRELGQVRTPFSLAWGLLGLGAWGELPDGAPAWTAESVALQGGPGRCRTTHLALLALAAQAKSGLAAAVTRCGNDRQA